MYNQNVSGTVQLTLVPISFGVGYATIYDLNLNTFGFGIVFLFLLFFWLTLYLFPFRVYFEVIACCAVIATGMAQIFTNTYQKSLNCDALQLLYHTSPYIALVKVYSSTSIYGR
jgi:glucan phosphoethanolaminetransferase (alkaline phosphatase superfamily)